MTFVDPSIAGDPGVPDPMADDLEDFDPDLAPPGLGVEAGDVDVTAADPSDLLAQAEAAMSAPLTKPLLTLEVEGRPGFTVTYDVNIPEPQLRVYEERARVGRKGQEKLDSLAFACILVANCAKEIRFQGTVVEDAPGRPRLFGSKAMHRLYRVDGARQAVRRFLGDPGADAHADAIMAKAGYGERAREVDPTQPL